MLFLVATPIGNLADFTQRAIDTLKQSDLILCEDTRHSLILLRHYAIEKPLLSFHQFNEQHRKEQILHALKRGQMISLISDAGTPLISDPGSSLIHACIENNIPFTAIPGPCSIIQALVLSGFEPNPFQFIGFLPRKKQELLHALRHSLCYQGTTLAFESPERLIDTLEALASLAPQRTIALARELTKVHEECRRGSVTQLLTHFRSIPPRGECILLIEKGLFLQDTLPLEELITLLQELHGLSLKEAIHSAAVLTKTSKKNVYKAAHRC